MVILNTGKQDEIRNLILQNEQRIEKERENLKDVTYNENYKNTIKSLRKIEDCTLIIESLSKYLVIKKGVRAI